MFCVFVCVSVYIWLCENISLSSKVIVVPTTTKLIITIMCLRYLFFVIMVTNEKLLSSLLV